MANQQLIDYIKQQLKQGVEKEQIKNSLLANGWQEADINEAFDLISNLAPSFQSSDSRPTITFMPSAISILGQAWELYQKRLGTFVGIMIIPMLVLITTFLVFLGGGLLGFLLLYSKFKAGGIGLLIILSIAFYVIVFISQLWGQTALLYAIKDSEEGIGIVEAYRRGWYKILSYWWILFLSGFITIGGSLLFIVFGIIFGVWFSLAIFVLIAEDLKGMNALLKSREYVKGKWGSVFWRFLFIGILSSISLIAGSFLGYIGQFLIGLFLPPLIMTYGFLVYKNLRILKGEFVFVPTVGQKIKFIAVGIIGFLLMLTIIFSTVFLVMSFKKDKTSDIRHEKDIRQIQKELEFYRNKY